jgi:hypothetical protein
VQPAGGEGLVVVFGLPDVDVAQPALDQAADIVWATNATELYQLLVGQRGWTPQRYQRFLTDTWGRLLLAD